MMVDNNDILVNVLNASNSLLAIGFMSKLNDDEMEIRSKDNEVLPILLYNTPIKIKLLLPCTRIFMSGRIHGCNNNIWRVGELNILSEKENRNSFRQVLNTNSCIRTQNNRTIECKIVDLSTGGTLISTKQSIPSEIFILKLEYNKIVLWVTCKMLRRERLENGDFKYGCKFKGISETTKDKISRMLFEIQKERIKNL